jgi:hypothetical protein
MAGDKNALRNPDLALALAQSGGIAGLEMKATLRRRLTPVRP